MSVPSVWGETSALPQAPSSSASCDVVVIGAGIAGLSVATMLQRAGASVRVVARHPLHASVSGRSNAKVTALHQLVYADLRRRHGADAAATYADASQRAVRWVAEQGGDLTETRAAVTVALDADQAAQLEAEHDAASRAGLSTTLEQDAPDWPGPVTAALRLPDQAQVDPVALLARLALRLGPDVLHDGAVHGVLPRLHGVRVRGSGWHVDADHAVVATGLPITDRGGFFGLVEPQASYILAIEQDPAHVPAGQDMQITAGSDGKRSIRWATAAGRPVVLVGGEGHRTGAAPEQMGGAATDALRDWAHGHLTGLGREVAAWSAQDFISADRLPFAGPELRLGGRVHVITGLNKWGFTLGVACAEALAHRIVDGTMTPFAELVDTARLPDLRALPDLAGSQVDVGRHMLSGWAKGLTDSPDQDPPEGSGSVGRCGPRVRGVARDGGRTHDVSAICPHLGGIVSWNAVDRTWDCPLHGSRFEPDGAVRHSPTTRGLGS